MTFWWVVVIALFSLGLPVNAVPRGKVGFDSIVVPFFKANCVKCHGPKKAKGKVTLHELDGNLVEEQSLEQWELILDVLKTGEMPPEEEVVRPTKQEVLAVSEWIDTELRNVITKARNKTVVPQARRLTNFEYENTIRDLIGFQLDLKDNLPKDPEKPYHRRLSDGKGSNKGNGLPTHGKTPPTQRRNTTTGKTEQAEQERRQRR